MTLSEFVEKYDGKYVEVAGSSAQNQCVDLANAYIREVLGMPIVEHTDAKDFPSRIGDGYDWIEKTDSNFPQDGDIVIWNSGLVPSGHIDICISDDASTFGFDGFDQNWPLGSVCKHVRHNYNHVDGWLRLKKTEEQEDNQLIKRYMKIVTTGQMVWTKINDVTEFWVISKREDGTEVKRLVIQHIRFCALAFAVNDHYCRWSTPDQLKMLAGYPEGKEYDIAEQFQNHPEIFEKQ